MKEILEKAQRASETDIPVLLIGETGVGKEHLARMIHHQNLHSRKPFLPLNCSAVPSSLLESELFGHEKGAFTSAHCRKIGILETAQGGTVFLDEIGDMGSSLQPKLLRVLEEKTFIRIGGTEEITVNFRLVSATNQDLRKLVEQGKFRKDLYYRLKGMEIYIPPLRERREDILPLIEYYLGKYSKKYKKDIIFSSKAKEILLNYTWPGNVRELMHVIESLVVTAEDSIISERQLPVEILDEKEINREEPQSTLTLKEVIQNAEKRHILRTLKISGYNKTQTAKLLGIALNTLKAKIKLYGIEDDKPS